MKRPALSSGASMMDWRLVSWESKKIHLPGMFLSDAMKTDSLANR